MNLCKLLAALLLLTSNLFGADADEALVLKRVPRDLKSTNSEDRTRAIVKVKELGDKARPILPELCLLSIDRSPKTRQAALEALEIVDPKLHKVILPIVVDQDDNVQIANVQTLAAMGKDGKLAMGLILEWTKTTTSDHGGEIGLQTLVKMDPADERVVKLILDCASKGSGRRTRLAAIKLLPNLSRTDDNVKKCLAVLTALLKTEFAFHAMKSLGSFKAAAKSALPLLKTAKLSPNGQIRDAAEEAIKQIESESEKEPKKEPKEF